MRWTLLALVFGLVAFPTPHAAACGGFFCSTSPINQAREVVVYGHEPDGTLTMAVQIAYEGQDEDFAWILPVPVPPDEIAVGTDTLFQTLQQATEPLLQLDRRTEGVCAVASCSYPSYGGFGCGASAPAYERGGVPPGPIPGGGVTVYSSSVVGPYDTVVLGASTATEVIDWLGANGYDIPDASAPLLEPYAADGFSFVALRLNANRASSVIRPVVMRMATDEACLPIRLTAIAATPDLPIALFFLGDAQAHAVNYSFADPSRDLELWRGTRLWDEAVAARVAELGGQAFSTDYAGVTPEVQIGLEDVSDLASASTPGEFFEALRARRYQGSPLLQDLFERYIPPPTGVDPRAYYNCLGNGRDAEGCGGEPRRFDPAGLARSIDSEIRIPSIEAQALIDRHPYTTRLSTSMRPEDMTVDPVFAFDADLPDVPRERTATLVTHCGPNYFEAGAPQDLELDGEVFPFREGELLTARLACERMGGTLASEGGCSSSVGQSSAPTFALFLGLGFGAMYLVRRRR